MTETNIDHLNLDLDGDGELERYNLQDKRVDDNLINYSYANNKLTIGGGFSGSGDSSLHKYSTEERVVGIWTDGRPVYEKVANLLPDDVDLIFLNNKIDSGEQPTNIIPVMTSNTTPSGIATASSNRTSGYTSQAFHAFNEAANVWWDSYLGGNCPQWVMYEFDEPVEKEIIKLEYQMLHETNTTSVANVQFQVSLNGEDWTTIHDVSVYMDSNKHIDDVSYIGKFKYFRVYFVSSGLAYEQCRIEYVKVIGTDSQMRILQYTKTTD